MKKVVLFTLATIALLVLLSHLPSHEAQARGVTLPSPDPTPVMSGS